MDNVWALTPGTGDTGLALQLKTEWRSREKLKNPKLSYNDIVRLWRKLDFLRTGYVQTDVNCDDKDILKSALLATEEVDRILYREQEIYGFTFVKYDLTPDDLKNGIAGGSAGLAFALAFATKVYRINHQQHFRDIAATGEINKYGYVRKIGLLAKKIPLALEKFTDSGGYVLYPQDNESDVTPILRQTAQAKGVKLIPVKHLFDALSAIGIELKNINLNPFQGLDAYKYKDAPVFFGRDKETQEIIDRLKQRAEDGQGILLVCGASGSGKSSLIQAGVMPKLDNKLQDSNLLNNPLTKRKKYRWSLVKPRELVQSPLWDTLAAACCTDKGIGKSPPIKPVTPQDADSFLAWMHNVEQLRKTNNEDQKLPYIWVIDQLEELFTLNFTIEQQEAFSAALCRLVKAGHWVILCLRNDFFAQFQNQETLRSCVGDGIYTLGQPDSLAIDQMIQQPAWLAVCEYESANGISLATTLRKDLGHDTAALPLLSFTLQQLYEKTKSSGKNVFTYATYNEIGGINGAIGKKADEVYAGLPEDVRATLPRVIRTLTHINEQGTATARSALLSEFAVDGLERKLINAFVKARLFVIDDK